MSLVKIPSGSTLIDGSGSYFMAYGDVFANLIEDLPITKKIEKNGNVYYYNPRKRPIAIKALWDYLHCGGEIKRIR